MRIGIICPYSLTLPGGGNDGYAVSNGFIAAGNDLDQANVTVAEAEKHCSAVQECVGFTFEKTAPEARTACGAIAECRAWDWNPSTSVCESPALLTSAAGSDTRSGPLPSLMWPPCLP